MFIENLCLVYQSQISKFDELKYQYISKFGFKENSYKNSPEWVKNWIYYSLKRIQEETDFLNHRIPKSGKKNTKNKLIDYNFES